MSTVSSNSSPSHITINSLPEEEIQIKLPEPHPDLWQPGQPYKHEIPKPEGNIWQNVLDPIMKRDKEKCDAWKDEVQNLLIFAGLFSAIVTAFLIESYQTLQPNPQDTAVAILTHIATRLDVTLNQTGSSTIPSLPSQNTVFTPSSSAIRVNILWFISLILSLTVVLVGIVCMQWLREHQKYEGASPKNAFALHQMRENALARWRVPAFFAALPLLLEASLVFFFVGIATFLWNIHHIVAIWVIVAVCIPLLFLVLTTALPAMQILTLYDPRCQINDSVPAYCPYKSPQSRILCQFLHWAKPIFILTSWTFTPLYVTLFKYLPAIPVILLGKCRVLWRRIFAQSFTFPHLRVFMQNALSRTWSWVFAHAQKGLSRIPSFSIQDPEFKARCATLTKHLPSMAFNIIQLHSWTFSDTDFLKLRTIFNQAILVKELSSCKTSQGLQEPLFDLINGLRWISLVEKEPLMVMSAYHCFRDVASISKLFDESADARMLYHRFYAESYVCRLIGQLAWHGYVLDAGTEAMGFLTDTEVKKLFWFFRYTRGIPEIEHHRAELSTRLLAGMMTSNHPKSLNEANWPLADSQEWNLWTECVYALTELDDFDEVQQILLLHAFFRLTLNDPKGQLIKILRSESLDSFMLHMAPRALRLIQSPHDAPAFQHPVAFLAYISNELAITEITQEDNGTPLQAQRIGPIDGWPDPQRFSFFWCSSLFLSRLAFASSPSQDVQNVFGPVFTAWLTYKNYVGATGDQFESVFPEKSRGKYCFEKLERAAARYAEAGDVESQTTEAPSQPASLTAIPYDYSDLSIYSSDIY